MLRGAFEEAGEQSPEDLRASYDDRLASTVQRVGISTVAERTGVDEATLSALVDGESPELTLEEAAAILSTDDDLPDTDVLEAEARDLLLMGMSMAVLDVDGVAAGINDAMDPKEIQQKVEGRFPMTLDEYAVLHSYIESRRR